MGIRIFDKYLFKKMLVLFLEEYGVLLIIYIILDLLFGKDLVVPKSLIEWGRFCGYYILSLHRLLGNFFAVLIFFAAGRTLATVDEKQELLALKTMGVSPARIMAPLCICALLISLSNIGIREVVFPHYVTLLSATRNDFITRPDQRIVCRFQDDLNHLTFYGVKCNQTTSTVTKPKIVLDKDITGYDSPISAQTAQYFSEENNRPSGWLISDVSTPVEMLRSSSVTNPDTGRIIIYSAVDTDWLNEKDVFLVSDVTPVQLLAGKDWVTNGNIRELWEATKNPSFKSLYFQLVISTQTRLHSLLFDLAPFFLGGAFYLLLEANRKAMEKFVRSLLMALGFTFLQVLVQTIGTTIKNPFIAVCGPLFFVPFVFYYYLKLWRKEV